MLVIAGDCLIDKSDKISEILVDWEVTLGRTNRLAKSKLIFSC